MGIMLYAGNAFAAYQIGTPNNDVITGTDQRDTQIGGKGDDHLNAGS
jgi:hypothetical protein